jgi:membrane-associated phospholipid phosphatase
MHPSRIAIALLLLLPGSLFAKAPSTAHYLAPDSVNVRALLPPPPDQGTPESRADTEGVLARQQFRTPADILRARREAMLSPAIFSDILGPWFDVKRLPLTFALLENAADDAEAISAQAKSVWNRPRPSVQDHDIHPVVPVPNSPSYPSGHAMRGALWSIILAKLAPENQDRILARGAEIGEDRIIAGVHFPSDVAAGQTLGSMLAVRLLADPSFQRDFARAQAEFSHAYHHFSCIDSCATVAAKA